MSKSREKRMSPARLMLLVGLLLVLAITASTIGATGNTAAVSADKSYIVIMEGLPLAAQDVQSSAPGAAQGGAAAAAAQAEMTVGHNQALQAVGASSVDKIYSYTHALNGFAAILTPEQAKEMAEQAGVVRVMEDYMRYPTTEVSPEFLGLTEKGGAWLRGFDGEGVVVGVIDSGIWPEHPSFEDDGSYAAPPIVLDDSERSACDFGNTAQNPNDVAFTCNNKLIGARQMLDTYRALIGAAPDEFNSARDDDGHGTHTASTTAGNSGVEADIFGIPRGVVSGIAPRAHIVAYKGLGNLGGFGSDLAAAIDQAVFDGVDVINYSVGGGPSLLGADDLAYLFAADAGIFVATSASNNGPGPGTIGGPASVPWLTSVGASTHPRTFQGSAASSDGWEFFGASITEGTAELELVDAEDFGDPLCGPGLLDPAVAGKVVLCLRGGYDRVAKSLAVDMAGGAGMILFNANDGQSEVTDNHWVPSVHINNTDGLVIKDYIDSAGTAAVAQINGGVSTVIDAPWMAGFSSRGPNTVAEDIIKPDITAPGVNILAGNSPFPDPGFVQGELYQSISGTSMSSPHIAGIFALVKQAHPDWSPAKAKSAMMTTAYQDGVMKEDGVTPADPFDMGAGHVTAFSYYKKSGYGSVAEEAAITGWAWGRRTKGTLKNTAFDAGLYYDAGFNEYLGFLCDAAPEAFSDPAGTCASLDAAGIPTDASDLNIASIAVAELPGSQTVVRTVTADFSDLEDATGAVHGYWHWWHWWKPKKVVFQAKVDAPEGYSVTVSPKKLKLEDGESATFEVTIVNESAPIGEWAFGSMTWKGDGYLVRSPIAVRAATFDAPDAVAGTGADGSASFDVLFGYTGDYTAAPHGLSANAPTTAAIGQDPDQTYPSPDDAPGPAGGADKISYPITAAAFVRWELAIPGDDDIDLFLEDSAGNIIAASTNGGTDELIELFLPADDTYTMVVHGWSVPNAPLPYTLNYWEVPLASGGSLSVDAAPAAAVQGEVGTIDLSWTGLAAGTSYLGAVSHTDAVGLLGVTLVEVDVP